MGHCIAALIGREEIVSGIAQVQKRKTIPLAQDFAMLFLTDDLLDQLSVGVADGGALVLPDLSRYTNAVAELMERHSRGCALGYIQTEYFGGAGGQGGVLYENGKERLPPQWQEGTNGAINQILAVLGVVRDDQGDEFDSLGLGRYRHMDDE